MNVFRRLREQVEATMYHLGLDRPEPELAVPKPAVVALPGGGLVVLHRWADQPPDAAFEAQLAEAQASDAAVVVISTYGDDEDAPGRAQSAGEGQDTSPVDCVAPEPILAASPTPESPPTAPAESIQPPAGAETPPAPIWSFSRTGLSREAAIDAWVTQFRGEQKLVTMIPWPPGGKKQ